MVGQWEDDEEVVIRCYDDCTDRTQMDCLEKSCEIGHDHQTFLFTDTLGDPLCRIRNCPLFTMLVAEVGKKLVGSVQGSVKPVEFHDKSVSVGYVLGLKVVPPYRRRGIGSALVRKLEEWFVANKVDYAYMATQKDNEASLGLFVGKLGYVVFRNPSILVNPVNPLGGLELNSDIEIKKLKVEEAESWYRRHVAATTEFFPDDIDKILGNKLSMGTWVAYYNNNNNIKSYAMLSVWNSSKLFKLKIGKAPLSFVLLTKVSNFIRTVFPFSGLTELLPDLFTPFGFYFIYGVHAEGPLCGRLVRALCEHVHNMAASDDDGACKVVVVEVDGEVNGDDSMVKHIPHWKMLSCDDDMWCIKPLKCEVKMAGFSEFSEISLSLRSSSSLFVDPRDV